MLARSDEGSAAMLLPQPGVSTTVQKRSRQLYLGMGASLLLVAVVAGALLAYMHRQVELRIAVSSQNLAKTLQQSIDQLVDTVNVSTLSATDEISRQVADGKINPTYLNFQLMRLSARLPDIKIQATSERGIISYNVDTAMRSLRDLDVSQRDYFKLPRDDPSSTLFIGPPVFSPTSQSWGWEFSRAARSRDGAFLGVVYARIDVSVFQKMFAELQLESRATVALRDRNLCLIAGRMESRPQYPITPGSNSISTQMQQALAANPAEGSYHSAATRIDDQGRTFAYSRSQKYGFLVNAGITGESSFSEWRKLAMVIGTLIALLGLAGLVFVRIVVRSWHDQTANMLALRQAQEATEFSNTVLDQALEMAKCGTWTVDIDHDGSVPHISQRAARLMGLPQRPDGYSQNREWTRCIVEAAGQEKTDEVIRQYEEALTGKSNHYDAKYPIKRVDNGAIMWVHDMATVTQDASGKPVFMRGVTRDITLEQMAEEAIIAAMQEAEAASLAKGDFLANMSHEIRTPMNAIIGLSGLALKNEMPPRIHDYLSKISQSGEHLLRIINDILDFSKIESGKLEIEAVPFEMESVIDNLVNLISEKAEAKNLELVCSLDSALPKTLVGDPLRIGQILINYANNAVKFASQGAVCIAVRVERVEGQEVLLHFSVKDSGIGLTQEQIGRLFQSFAQADSTTTRQYGGTGLGLAISKNLAYAMGGQVGVQSEFGCGSTFWFTARLGIGSSEKIISRTSIDLHGRRVLVVDDNEAAALVLCELLVELGFEAQPVHSGPAALQALADADPHAPFHFVMMDWQMPGMDGLETVRVLQQMKTHTAPFVLMVTAHRRQELLKGAQMLGIEHVLSKPVSASLLVNTMMQLMGQAPRDLPPARSQQDASTLEAAMLPLAGARILLVEDNEINQMVACELLRGAGLDVDVAENGQIGVHQVHARDADNQPYDMVLMDMQMPVMDGITASRLIRESYTLEELPIVAMTANAMQADKERCLAAGMNAFVSKPINPEELWRAMLGWIKLRPGLGQTAVRKAPVVVNGAQAELLDALRTVEGLDVEQGLSLTNHNATLYLTMLGKFVSSQEHAVQQMQAALSARDGGRAELLAHTLKGLAASMGADPLRWSAAALEQALHAQADAQILESLLRDTQQRLHALVAGLRATPGLIADPARQSSAELTPDQRAQLQDVIQRLQHMLEQDDSDAQSLWDAHAPGLRAVLQQADALEQAINNFDFDQALSFLQPQH